MLKPSLSLGGAGEYPDCIFADSTNKCPGYYPKQSDGDAPTILELWTIRNIHSFIAIAPRFTLTRSDST